MSVMMSSTNNTRESQSIIDYKSMFYQILVYWCDNKHSFGFKVWNLLYFVLVKNKAFFLTFQKKIDKFGVSLYLKFIQIVLISHKTQ